MHIFYFHEKLCLLFELEKKAFKKQLTLICWFSWSCEAHAASRAFWELLKIFNSLSKLKEEIFYRKVISFSVIVRSDQLKRNIYIKERKKERSDIKILRFVRERKKQWQNKNMIV